ncbi:hypothetical protein [Cryobacterium sp. PH29-G1]|uniref:hypothetical protein n=1 Tax=Cryobacterium sp. PH29-G1 TaxID=3046211 RepID=UPI0024BAF390|nr:hypothetical protein [Cryobacterium sp. PH29-G1]MDJ0348007.1 hypothetical protein [Cryobacterium sp. PH29-G1]
MLFPAGILFPETVLRSEFFSVLAAFVAVNTVIYATLAISRILPTVYPGDLVPGRRRRAETRSIFPEAARDDRDGARHLRTTPEETAAP